MEQQKPLKWENLDHSGCLSLLASAGLHEVLLPTSFLAALLRYTRTLASAASLPGRGQHAHDRTVCDVVRGQDHRCKLYALRRARADGSINDEGCLPIFATVHAHNSSTTCSRVMTRKWGKKIP